MKFISVLMILLRRPESIYQVNGSIQNGTFHGRWHFSFGDYYDPKYMNFGTLRVFNDDTLSPGAVWPLHPHKDNEVVTYCAQGEFKHADERGDGGILKKGWVQHTTVGRGMWHSEINNLPDKPMRFIQMWFAPIEHGLEPSVEQKKVKKAERTNRILPLVSNIHSNSLKIASDAQVHSCFLEGGRRARYNTDSGRGVYLYVLEGGPVETKGESVRAFGALMITDEREMDLEAKANAELLLVDVLL